MRDLELVRRARDALYLGNFMEALRCLDEFVAQNGYEMTEGAVLDRATDIHHARYITSLEKRVKVFFEQWKEGEFNGDRREMEEALRTQCEVDLIDDAQNILRFSRYAEAAQNRIGVEALDWDGDVPWCGLAYYALEAELEEALKNHEVNIYKEPPKEPVEMCQFCGTWQPRKGWKNDHCGTCEEVDAGSSSGPGPEPM